MDISHSIENEIISKLSDVVYIRPSIFPIFMRTMCYNGQLSNQTGYNNTYAFSYNIKDFEDLIYYDNNDYKKFEIEYNKRHEDDYIRGYTALQEYVAYNVCKRTMYDPASVYIKNIHRSIYNSAEKIDKEYDIRYFSNTILGRLDDIRNDIKESKLYGLGKPFIICSRNQISRIEKYAFDYTVEKCKYADVYDKRCEFIRKYGDIQADKETIGLYVDDFMTDDDEIILGMQSLQLSIGVQLYYYSICTPLHTISMNYLPYSSDGRVGYTSMFAVMSTKFDSKIYKRIRFFEHIESKEEIEEKDFKNRVEFFNKN